MPRSHAISLCLIFFFLCGMLLCSIPAPAAEPPWLEVHSVHYTVITDAGDKKGREVALRFEQMRSVFALLLTKERLNQSVPLTILAFKNDQSYYQLAPLRQGQPIDVPGFFLPSDDQNFIVLNLSEDEPWRAVAHDFATMLLTYNYPPAQGWFDEGLAEYFSSIRLDNKEIELGGDPELRPSLNEDLLGNQRDAHPAKSLAELLGAQVWMPLPDLFTLKQTNSNAALPPNAGVGQTYRFAAPVGPDETVITSNALSEPNARAFYADVAVRIPERRERGLQELHGLASAPTAADKKFDTKNKEKRPTEDPDLLPTNAIGSPLAHRILAWDHIQHGEFDEASTDLADASALNPRDMWLRYYLSVLKYRVAQAKHADMQGLPNMMIDLRSVLDWYPEFAGAYDLLAVARNEGGSTPAAMQAERAAIGLSPRNELYTFHLAQIYVSSKKWEASEVLLDRLKGSSNPQIVALARELQERAGAERKYGIPVGTGTPAQAKLAPQKSPFDVLEEDAAKRDAAEKASQSGGSENKRPTKFIKGRLVTVDCSQAPSAILTISSGGMALKLRASDYKSLLLIGADDFSCDWRDRQVTANYKPRGAKDGDLVSLEVR